VKGGYKLILCSACHDVLVRDEGGRICVQCYRTAQRTKPPLCLHCGTTDEERFDLRPKLGSRGVCRECVRNRERAKMQQQRERLAQIDLLPQCAPDPRGCEMKHHSVDGTGLCAFCRMERFGQRLSDVLRGVAA
jgi:hypothetical protein